MFLLGQLPASDTVQQFVNHDLDNIFTPVNVQEFEFLLKKSGFDTKKAAFLVEGFTNGFHIGYQGDRAIKRTAPNLKLVVGNKVELWNKVMKEVELKRFAGPFPDPPFEHFMQSPIGLVPKDGGKKTRLIFHLSYPRLKKKKQ